MPAVMPQEVIARKRDKAVLRRDEIVAFVRGIASGEVGEAQMAAFAMAVCLNGMTPAETAALTRAMRDSGATLSWNDFDGPILDKHSTGGVGDKVSLILAPVLAACGAFVPMLSGRGLGHTGGTLDKLESLTGYDVRPDPDRLRRVVREAGCAIVGAGEGLAPADARLYAVRDVTATVASVPLIVASILAKKLAEGAQALVIDVKCGSGAFLANIEAARGLADALVETALAAGLPCRALVTDMDWCVGHSAGNALEVAEAVAVLRGEGDDPRLRDLVLALAAEAMAMGGIAAGTGEGRGLADRALASGEAAERFGRMVRGLGGPDPFVWNPSHGPGGAAGAGTGGRPDHRLRREGAGPDRRSPRRRADAAGRDYRRRRRPERRARPRFDRRRRTARHRPRPLRGGGGRSGRGAARRLHLGGAERSARGNTGDRARTSRLRENASRALGARPFSLLFCLCLRLVLGSPANLPC